MHFPLDLLGKLSFPNWKGQFIPEIIILDVNISVLICLHAKRGLFMNMSLAICLLLYSILTKIIFYFSFCEPKTRWCDLKRFCLVHTILKASRKTRVQQSKLARSSCERALVKLSTHASLKSVAAVSSAKCCPHLARWCYCNDVSLFVSLLYFVFCFLYFYYVTVRVCMNVSACMSWTQKSSARCHRAAPWCARFFGCRPAVMDR